MPEQPGGLAGLLLRLLSAEVREQSFEPAWNDLIAEGQHSGRLARVLLRARAIGLVIECLRLQSQERRQDGDMTNRNGVTMADAFLRDLRIAARSLGRRPGFALVAVLTLALGIGASTAIFSVVNGVLLRPLPFVAPERLVTIEAVSPQDFGVSVSVPNFEDWRKRNRVFSDIAGFTSWSMVDRTDGRVELIEGSLVFGPFFELLGVEAALGRAFPAEHTLRGGSRVVVLSNAFWSRAYGGDPGVVGRTLDLMGEPYTVIGVMPPGFGFPSEAETAAYVPMGALAEELPWDDRDSSFGTRVLARLAAGVTLAAAQSDMNRVTGEVDELEGRPIATARVRPLADYYLSDVRGPVLILMGAVLSVLLIACVNVANLLLTRAEGRRGEIALCMAMGASRSAILRQHLAESMVLAGASVLVGMGMSVLSLRVLLLLTSDAIPPALIPAIRIDGRVLGFALLLGCVAALAFGLAPAWRSAAHARMSASLREGWRGGTAGPRRVRLRSALVAAEMSLAFVLLVGSVLMLKTLASLRGPGSGYSHENVLTARVGLPDEAADRDRWLLFYESVLERLHASPGVRSAAATLLVPLSRRSWELRLLPEGVPYDPNEGASVLYNIVSTEYFATMGIPILRGRGFTNGDAGGTPLVAIIDETMAERLWPGEDALGRRITVEQVEDSTTGRAGPLYRTVVGVVPNVRHYDLRTPSRIQVYVPLRQAIRGAGNSLYVAVRMERPAAGAFANGLRDAVYSVDRTVVVASVRTLDDYVGSMLSREQSLTGLLTVFGMVAAVLAAIGVFGVTSLVVATRAKEIGLRLAIGARPREVVRMILLDTSLLAGVGAIAGLLMSTLLARLLRALLHGVNPLDATTYAGAAAFLLAIALAASLLPAFRAARLDPMSTLRQDA